MSLFVHFYVEAVLHYKCGIYNQCTFTKNVFFAFLMAIMISKECNSYFITLSQYLLNETKEDHIKPDRMACKLSEVKNENLQ